MQDLIDQIDIVIEKFKNKYNFNINYTDTMKLSYAGRLGSQYVEFDINNEKIKANIMIELNKKNNNHSTFKIFFENIQNNNDYISVINQMKENLGTITVESTEYYFEKFDVSIVKFAPILDDNYNIKMIELMIKRYGNYFHLYINISRDLELNIQDKKDILLLTYLQIFNHEIINNILDLENEKIYEINNKDHVKDILQKYRDIGFDNFIYLLEMSNI